MEILTYSFMQRAIIVGLLISVITPLIGNIIVLKRLSNMGEALSHCCLAGVAIGLFIGINPITGAVIVSVLSALLIDKIRLMFPQYQEMSVSIILSLGIALAAIFSGFVNNTQSFSSFLFGSVVAITFEEMLYIVVLSIAVILIFIFYYKELFYITFDEQGAYLDGVNTNKTNFIFTILIAITVSVSSKIVGALIISSLMIIPVACSMLISKSYKQNILFSLLFAMFFTLFGLILSGIYDLKPGGTIVLTGIFTLFIVKFLSSKKL